MGVLANIRERKNERERYEIRMEVENHERKARRYEAMAIAAPIGSTRKRIYETRAARRLGEARKIGREYNQVENIRCKVEERITMDKIQGMVVRYLGRLMKRMKFTFKPRKLDNIAIKTSRKVEMYDANTDRYREGLDYLSDTVAYEDEVPLISNTSLEKSSAGFSKNNYKSAERIKDRSHRRVSA